MVKNLGNRVTSIDTRTAPVKVVERERGRPRQRQRQRIFERDGYLCQSCAEHGRVTLAREVDHVVPLWAGGGEGDDNQRSLCRECHRVKTDAEEADRGKGDAISTGL